MEELLKEVLAEIKPSETDRKKMLEISDDLLERARNVASELEVSIEPKLVGSAARETWLKDELDIDLFILFSPDVSREKLEEKGLEIGKKIAEGGGSEQFAEHPYIKFEKGGVDVDVVPCYDIDDPSNLKSAVDRSPHHQEYIKGWLTSDLADEVLLLKKFMSGIGVYGSELEVHGFSGYLCELLIIEFGSFSKLVESAAEWGSKKVISRGGDRSPEKLQSIFPEQPLIFVDPVDPGRNVAASISKKNYAVFVRACQDFIQEPKKKFFFPNSATSSKDKIQKLIESRGSKIFAISFEIPFDLVPDIVYPQLRKTRRSIENRLQEGEFKVLRSSVWSKGQRAVILIELEVSELPSVRTHVGPPLGVEADSFIQKHLDSERTLAGPFMEENGRLVFELKRSHVAAKEVIREAMESREGFGSHVEKAVEKEGYEILEEDVLVEFAEKLDFLEFIGDYLTRCLPWYR